MSGLLVPTRRRVIEPLRRSVKWCPVHRRFAVVNMAAGDRMLDASGNRCLDASGNLQLDDGAGNTCSCTPPAVPCANCTDATPAHYAITLSSITLALGTCF